MKTTLRYRVFKHQQKEDGTCNVKIRVYHNGKEKYLPTKIFASKTDMKNYILKENTATFRSVQNILSDYTNKLTTLSVEIMDIEDLCKALKSEQKNITDLDFYDFTGRMIERMKGEGRASTANNYHLMLNSVRRYISGNLPIQNIDVAFLKSYEHFLRTNTFKIGNREHKTGPRGISLYMGLIRAVINEAVREYPEINSPFDHGRYRIPKEPQPEQRSLPVNIIRQIRDLKITGRAAMARDMFMLSFYLMGMNAADLYACEIYRDGRIDYNRQKTASRRQDRAFFSVKVYPEAETIIHQYRGEKRVLCFSETYSSAHNFNRALREGLKQIENKIGIHLEFYAARHSFASIARNDCGIDKYTVHESLNHVDEATKITDTYIRRDWRLLDEMNRKVLEYLKAN